MIVCRIDLTIIKNGQVKEQVKFGPIEVPDSDNQGDAIADIIRQSAEWVKTRGIQVNG